MFTPVVDIGVHQANVHVGLMRSRWVGGVIIRTPHADGAGFDSFANPQRGAGPACARATVDAIRRLLGHTEAFYMVDIEDHANEPAERSTAEIRCSRPT